MDIEQNATAEQTLAELDEEQLNNLKEILSDDDEMSLNDLVETFLENAEEQLSTLKEAVLSGDRKCIVETAHSIKGSSSNFGATKMVRISREIQTTGDSAPEDHLGTLTTDLRLEFNRVRSALKEIG
ncbi:MAG: Hpt domain-containing protein [Verrucomicrobiota bacterium]